MSSDKTPESVEQGHKSVQNVSVASSTPYSDDTDLRADKFCQITGDGNDQPVPEIPDTHSRLTPATETASEKGQSEIDRQAKVENATAAENPKPANGDCQDSHHGQDSQEEPPRHPSLLSAVWMKDGETHTNDSSCAGDEEVCFDELGSDRIEGILRNRRQMDARRKRFRES